MSKSVNKKIIIGNMVHDPELRYTGSGTAVLNLRVATNESFKGADGEYQDRATFHRCVAWGRVAEILAEYTQKGSRIYLEGRDENSEYEYTDKETGEVRQMKTMEMTVREFMFLDSRGDSDRSEKSETTSDDDGEDLPF